MGMMECINAFVDTMLAEQSKFETMQNEITRREDEVLAVLRLLERNEKEIIDAIDGEIAQTGDEAMREIFEIGRAHV